MGVWRAAVAMATVRSMLRTISEVIAVRRHGDARASDGGPARESRGDGSFTEISSPRSSRPRAPVNKRRPEGRLDGNSLRGRYGLVVVLVVVVVIFLTVIPLLPVVDFTVVTE